MEQRKQPGDRVGRFTIERHLASGGMGDVYVARQSAGDGRVALKLVSSESPTALRRFRREYAIAADLAHPHVVATHEHGVTDEGHAYIAMELLEGEDLDSRLARAPLGVDEVVTVACQVCEVLEVAHARGVVHRDLKPDNIFLVAGDALLAKVLDFGVARLMDESRMTRTGTLVGTLSYMSPEQARGETEIGPKSDLWALGVVLYEALAGRLPFEAPSGPGTLFKIVFETPEDLARLRPSLPAGLVEVVRRCLARPASDRFESAAALRAALLALDPEELRAVPPLGLPRAPVDTAAATLATDRGATDVTLLDVTAGTDVENRLATAVFLARVSDVEVVRRVAEELEGHVTPLVGGDVLVVFGLSRWAGDEPLRAARLAAACAGVAHAIGVATGHARRGVAEVVGEAVDDAVRLAGRGDVRLDATTSDIARRSYHLEVDDDGSSRLDPRGSRPRHETLADTYETPFVGRDLELSVLLGAAEASANDFVPGGVLVLGAAGMGKSRLRHEAVLRLAERVPDATVLWAVCEAFRRDTPFAGLVDALRGVVDPSLLKIFDATQGGGDPVAFQDRTRGVLASQLDALAEAGSVVLAIDDAQWLDPTSRAAIRWVLEQAEDLPLCVWLFTRPEGKAALADLVPTATSLELRSLSKQAAHQVLTAIAGRAPSGVLERADGHPLFLEELGRLVARGQGDADLALPPSIEGAHLAQIDQLEPLDREYLKRAAVFGPHAFVEGVERMGGDPGALPRLRKAGMLAPRRRSRLEGAREVSFRSQLLREVAYGLWTPEQVTRLHAQAAAFLEEHGGDAEELAHHHEGAGDREAAAERYCQAAEATVHAGDAETTRALAERVLELTLTPRLLWRALVARDTALLPGSERAAQAKGLEALAGLAAELGEEERIEAEWRACIFARIGNDRDGCLAHGERAIALAGEAGSQRWASMAHNELVLLFADAGDFERAASHAARARELALASHDDWLLARVSGVQGYVLSEQGRALEALDLYDASAAGFAHVGDRRREALAKANAGDALLEMGRLTEARELLSAAIEGSRKVGNRRTVAVASANLASLERIAGGHEAAARLLEEAGAEARRLDHARLLAAVAAERILLRLETGAPPDALRASVEEAARVRAEATSPSLALFLRAAEVRGRRALGEDVVEGVAALREGLADEGLHPHFALAALVALHGSDLGTATEVEAARALLATILAQAPSGGDQEALRRAVARRYLVPDALSAR